ncbi:protein phosphatase 1 regulatory subunit 12C [Antennarius striatus]|uniref:protein phosphatase 1 regulatory subunit 12C n=1 Tax=Antennarius striatus TaxID=241820 RepID=UPI0035AF50E3
MGDSARAKRREQLKRWAGSCTDRASGAARRRRGVADRSPEPDAEPPGEPPVPGGRGGSSPLSKRPKRVRFDRAAEFLAACASGDTEEALLMLKEDEDLHGGGVSDIINCSNADGITALHQACIDGSVDTVSFLLEHHASVNQVDSEGWTPLHAAASCGYPDIADLLLQGGASLTAVNCDGDVPLDLVLDESTESLLQEATRRQGVDLEAAKRLEEEQILSDAQTWLIEGPPPDVRHPRTGATPLHVAAAKGYLEALRLLCRCGMDVSAADADGWTPLHAAAHWGQGDACCLLAQQLCDMEARSHVGQTPLDVADESVEELLEQLELQQPQWREQSMLSRQTQPTSNAAGAQNKRRRSSVCRMSSKDKMSVQDQSKERGVSGGLGLSEEEGGGAAESSTASSPDGEGNATPPDMTAEDQDHRTARVQPSPQKTDAESPNAPIAPGAPSADRRRFQAPVRDEESESQRKARSRMMRQSRRSTQGVTLTDLKEAEKTAAKGSDPPPRSIQLVSPIVTVTPAERDTDPVKEEEPEGERRLGVKGRRRGRRERRSTGILQPGGDEEDEDGHLDDLSSDVWGGDASTDYRSMFLAVLQENLVLKEQLQEMELLLSQNKVDLERLRQTQERGADRPARLELDRFEKVALQRKAMELEDELKVVVDLRADNQRLKDENAALIRVISKLSR